MPVDLSMVGLEGDRHYNAMQLAKAQTRNTNATAQGQEIENQQTEAELKIQNEALAKLTSIAKGGRGSSGQDVVSYTGDDSKGAPLEQLGSMMIAGGAVKRGMEFLKGGVEIRKKESELLNDVETRNKNRLDNIMTVGNLFSQTLGTARNQSEWEYGIKQMESRPEAIEIFGRENFEALKKMDYDPNVATFLNEKAMSAIDRARLELSQQTNDREERNALDLAQYRRTTLEISKGNLDARRHEQSYKEKTDGKGAASAPSEAEVKAAKASVANLILDGKVPNKDDVGYAAFEAGAQDIASRAKQMVKENKGLDFNAAITRATIESKTDGDWQAMTPEDDRGFISKLVGKDAPEDVPNAKFRGRGAKALDPIEMPKSKAELKQGSYYVTARGVARWDGSKFVKD
jgi:hypothetical protein